MTKDLTKGSPLKLIILFTIPLIIGNIVQQLYNTVDTIIVGQTIGYFALSSVGLTGSLVFLVIGFAQGLTAGFSIITAQRFGNKDMEGVKKSVASTYILSFFANIFITLLSVYLTSWMLHTIQTPDNLYSDAYKYIIVIFWGTGAAILFNMYSSMLRAVGNSRFPLYILIIASIINVILDFVFILYFQMGVAGAGFATVISQLIPSIICFIYIKRNIPELIISKEHWKVDIKELWEHLRLGIPMGVQVIVIAVGIIILQWAVNRLGPIAVGAFTIAQRIDMLAVQVLISFGVTMATYTAQNYGIKNIIRIKEGVYQGTLIAVSISVFFGVLIYATSDWSIKVFISKEIISTEETKQIVEIVKTYLKVNCSMFFVLALLIIFRSALQGLGNGFIPTLAGVVELLMRTTSAVYLPIYFGYTGLAWVHPSAWVGAFISVIIAYIYIMTKLTREYHYKYN